MTVIKIRYSPTAILYPKMIKIKKKIILIKDSLGPNQYFLIIHMGCELNP